MLELLIENQVADILGEDGIDLTFTLNDIKQFYKRKSSYSKPYKLPFTNTNKAIFGYLHNMNTEDNLQNKLFECVLYEENTELFRGFIRLRNIINVNGTMFFDTNLLYLSKSIFNDMGNSKLTDLQWDVSTDHIYNLSAVKTTTQDSDTKPWIYAQTDNGVFLTGITSEYTLNDAFDNMDTDDMSNYFKPSVFIKSIFDKIFETYGYTYESDILDSDMFKNMLIPFANDDLTITESEQRILDYYKDNQTSYVLYKNYADALAVMMPNPYFYHGDSYRYPVKFNVDWFDPYSNAVINTTGTAVPSVYFIEKSGKYTYSLEYLVSEGHYPKNFNYLVQIMVNNASGTQVSLETIHLLPNETQYGIVQNIPERTITLEKGDYISIWIYMKGNEYDEKRYTYCTIDYMNLYLNELNIEKPIFGLLNNLKVNDYIAKGVQQSDLIKEVMKMFNLYLYVDVLQPKNYIFKQRDDFYIGGSSLVWTDKLLREDEVNIELNPFDFYLYRYEFKDSTDYHNEWWKENFGKEYGSKEIPTGNVISKKERTQKLAFVQTPFINESNDERNETYTYINGDKHPVSKIDWATIEGSSGGEVGPVTRSGKYSFRVLMKYKSEYLNPALVLTNYFTFDTNSNIYYYVSAIPFDYWGDQGEIDLTWSHDFNEYEKHSYTSTGTTLTSNDNTNLYSYYLGEMNNNLSTNTRIVTGKFRLTEKDINGLILNEKIYIDWGDDVGSGWFLINEIKDYNPSRLYTEVEFIKIIDGTYYNISQDYKPPIITGGDMISGGIDTVNITANLIYSGEDDVSMSAPLLSGGVNAN